ncbi:exonuclease, putative [Eimeria necatrix]|uniref:Exonuclease, putative n=1 Tax=Eimeria necatrix TaxID=51315 RepID=U6MUS7_9EIME|nr:exonuclease, putative [Eimeria necatrix]CDJ67746.1 exonuclease, putative [Eimeria necatrix]
MHVQVDKVIAACRELGIRCIVAPFEADAQLAYLSRTNQIHSAISEDSDLLAYGCKRVMLKMDKEGKCEELLRTLKSLTHERFVAMCVLGGCDYTNKVHINGKEEVVSGHLEAEKTFMTHKVFDPQTRRVVLIRSHATQGEAAIGLDTSFEEEDEKAIEMATGIIDPRTGAPRNTALSPAECALIRDCQEKAFNGLEARQLKAQIEAKQYAAAASAAAAEIAQSGAGEAFGGPLRALKETEEKQQTKAERHKQPCVTVRIARRLDAAADLVAPTTAPPAPPLQKEEPNAAAAVSAADTAAAVYALEAFAASSTLPVSNVSVRSSSSNKQLRADESVKTAKRLMQDMKHQGFHMPAAAAAAAACVFSSTAGSQLLKQSETDAAQLGCRDTAGVVDSATKTAIATVSDCSLSQFAFQQKQKRDGEIHTSKVPVLTGRRELITKTKFAHRTKLVYAHKLKEMPFPNLNSTIAAATERNATADGTSGSEATSALEGSGAAMGAAARTTETVADVAGAVGSACWAPVIPTAIWAERTGTSPPMKRRSSAAFLKADDRDGSSVFSNFKFNAEKITDNRQKKRATHAFG